MPVYCYRCEKCRKIHTDYRKRVEDRTRPGPVCCGSPTDFAPFAATVNSTDVEYDKPVLSESMGVHPSQVAEHRRMHPEIPMTDDGRVIIKSHNEYKRIRKRLGFFDKVGYC